MTVRILGNTFHLDDYLSRTRIHITIGRKSAAAYNCITIDDPSMDLFQCQLSKTPEGWLIENGQWRTDCPKGIHHAKEVVCNACMGCCINGTAGHPPYSWRYPAAPTYVNGTIVPEGGMLLEDSDTDIAVIHL